MRLRIVIFILAVYQTAFGQDTRPESSLLDYLLLNPSGVEQLQLDCGAEDCIRFMENASLFPDLRDLHMSGFVLPQDGSLWDNFVELRSLEISRSPEIDLKALFQQISGQASIKTLSLQGEFSQEIPRNVDVLKNVECFKITNNPGLNVQRTLQQLAHLPKLNELSLSQNHIDELSKNIGLLQNLEILDISVNNITRLPAEMRRMKNMKKLDVSGNLLTDPVATLAQIREINLTDLTIDQHIPKDELLELKLLFPNASIFLIDSNGDRVELGQDIPLTAGTRGGAIRGSSPDLQPRRSITYGKFNVASKPQEVYSDAYLHFAEVADKIDAPLNFDSLLFDDRFNDTAYSHTLKMEPGGEYKNLALSLYRKKNRGQVWFDFYKKERVGLLRKKTNGPGKKILKDNRELTAFTGMKWVYAGELSRKEFARKYVKKRWYLDCRIRFNQEDQNFTMVLKHKNGFEEIPAYPIDKKRHGSLEDAQVTYEMRHLKYEMELQKRRDRFHRRLAEDANRFRKIHEKAKRNAWREFKYKYLSEEERELSMEEWLGYYDQVIGNERNAIAHSGIRANFLKRSFELRDFVFADSTIKANQPGKRKVVLVDKAGKRLPEQQVMLIDYKGRLLFEYAGELGIKPLELPIGGPGTYALFAELRNGNYVIASVSDIAKALESPGYNKDIVVSKVDKKLYTVGQVNRFLSQ